MKEGMVEIGREDWDRIVKKIRALEERLGRLSEKMK